MAIEQEVKINFHLTFGALVQKSDDISGSASRDMDDLKEYGIKAEQLTHVAELKQEFLACPTDVELNGIKVGKTKDKNLKAEETRVAIRSVLKRIALKTGKKSWQYKALDHGDLSKMSDSDLCRAGYAVARSAVKFIATYSVVGLTQALLDILQTKTEEFDVLIDEQRDAVKARDKGTQDRRIAANSLYTAVMGVSDAGKAAYAEKDEAKYNDYVIYETPSGNAIPAGTGMLTGEITDQDGTPLGEVTVTVKGTTLVGNSDANGQYIIEGIKVGAYTVEAYKEGYNKSAIDDVAIPDGEATELDFDLVKEGMEGM